MKYIFTTIFILLFVSNVVAESFSPTMFDKFVVVNSATENNSKEVVFAIYREGRKLDTTLTVIYSEGKTSKLYITTKEFIEVIPAKDYFKYRLPVMLGSL